MTEDEKLEHEQTQHQIQLFCGLLSGLKLKEFVERLDRGESAAFIHDPTLLRAAYQSGKLEILKDTAKALLRAQQDIAKAVGRYQREHPDVATSHEARGD